MFPILADSVADVGAYEIQVDFCCVNNFFSRKPTKSSIEEKNFVVKWSGMKDKMKWKRKDNEISKQL